VCAYVYEREMDKGEGEREGVRRKRLVIDCLERVKDFKRFLHHLNCLGNINVELKIISFSRCLFPLSLPSLPIPSSSFQSFFLARTNLTWWRSKKIKVSNIADTQRLQLREVSQEIISEKE
jgi:hypothetical protein